MFAQGHAEHICHAANPLLAVELDKHFFFPKTFPPARGMHSIN